MPAKQILFEHPIMQCSLLRSQHYLIKMFLTVAEHENKPQRMTQGKVRELGSILLTLGIQCFYFSLCRLFKVEFTTLLPCYHVFPINYRKATKVSRCHIRYPTAGRIFFSVVFTFLYTPLNLSQNSAT